MKKILIILMILMIITIGCKKEVEAPEAPKPTEPVVTQPTPEIVEQVVEEPETPEPKENRKIQLTEPICAENKISMMLTNPSSESITLGKNAKIFINGIQTAHPVCDKKELEPGETIYCEDITGPIAIRKGATNKIHFNTKEGSVEFLVNCEVQE